MKILKLSCAACGSPLSIPEDLDQITCTSCGTGLLIERGEGYVALKVAEKLVRSIEESGVRTQDAIREGAQVTRTELQRLQLSQELSTTQMQLDSIQAEIRGLERDKTSMTSVKQLITLRQKEFQAMDRIRVLTLQLSSPDPKNLPACIEFAEWEYAWIDSEINALKASAHPRKAQLLSDLREQQNKVDYRLSTLKLRELKSRFTSFAKPDPPENDAQAIAELLALVNQDANLIRRLPYSSEKATLEAEITNRQKILKDQLRKLEVERFSGELRSLQYQPDQNDLAGLQDHLRTLDQDLQKLSLAQGSEAAEAFKKQLLDDRKRTIKQIKALEKNINRVNKTNPLLALFAAIGAGIAALFAGIALLLQPKPPQPGEVKPVHSPARQSRAVSAPDDGALRADIQPAKTGKNSVVSGIVLGFLTLLGFLILGFIAFGAASESTNLGMALFLLVSVIGVLLAARVFLRRATPGITIKGIFGLPDLVIRPKNPGTGLKNAAVVKVLIALITITAWSLFSFFIYTALSSQDPENYIAIFIIGVLLSPLVAFLVVKRTTLTRVE